VAARRARAAGRTDAPPRRSGYAPVDREHQARLNAFGEILQKLGWEEGRNIKIDYFLTGPDSDRLAAGAAAVVALAPDVILSGARVAHPDKHYRVVRLLGGGRGATQGPVRSRGGGGTNQRNDGVRSGNDG
jgi:hypothetical protein